MGFNYLKKDFAILCLLKTIFAYFIMYIYKLITNNYVLNKVKQFFLFIQNILYLHL